MEAILKKIKDDDLAVNDEQEFEAKLAQVQKRVDQLWNNARSATGADETGFLEKVNELRDKVKALDTISMQIG